MQLSKIGGKQGGSAKAGLVDYAFAAGLSLAALALYMVTKAGYVFPGASARLTALWRGLDASSAFEYPLTAVFAKACGASNALSVFCGAVATGLVFLLVSRFVRTRTRGDFTTAHAASASRLAGLVASLVFMLTPAVHEASTHLEPAIFDAMWALLAFAAIIPCETLPRSLSWFGALLAGALAGLGMADTPLFVALLPLYIGSVWQSSSRGGSNAWALTTVFIFSSLVAFFSFAIASPCDMATLMRGLHDIAAGWVSRGGWGFVAGFAVLPFCVAVMASRRSLSEDGGWIAWTFHLALTLMCVVAVATPLSPSAQMAPYAVLPVASCALAAASAGIVAAYWWLQSCSGARVNESEDKSTPAMRYSRIVGLVGCGSFAAVLLLTFMINLFAFDTDRGVFADRMAERAIADLGGRRWLVTDGTLDDHLRIAAEKSGTEINLVCLQRDLDKEYIKNLSAKMKEERLGGDKNADLSLSLSLGVLPFVQDWFAADPDIASKAAVWGAADLWYAAGRKPVPELLFFGADPARTVDRASAWSELDGLLHAPEGWGSYRLARNDNPVEKMRLDLRRHMGLLANNDGVRLHDEHRLAEAYDMYELVLRKIDADNICALFNEFELAREGGNPAAEHKNELERELKKVVDDPDRRYRLWALGNYYGYIRNPEIFVRLGYAWARSGRSGEALHQFRRAIDFIPTDRRSPIMNMMAALYASENDQRKSRAVYESVLESDADNHDALIGMMRLELLDGDGEKAMQYLERATASLGDDPRAIIDKALLRMMRNEPSEAKALLVKATDLDKGNLQAWSLLAAATIQQIDASKDSAEKAKLTKELEENILPTMEKQARNPGDYYVQTTRAFILMRKGAEKRREARDAFVAAARDRPDIAATGDIVLGLDISLNDTVDAERHAREVLRRNRKAPLANYVMGSLALQKGEYAEAEAFLRRAVDGPKPVVLALNDLAEVLRRGEKYDEAETFARKATQTDPNLYVAWETLGAIIMDRKGDLDEAERCVQKACELSKGDDGRDVDVRMLVSLARVQLAKGDKPRGKGTLRKVAARIDELSDFERREFEEIRKSAK